ncbi:MAG: DNA polymerase III subunit alpha [Deltaproteobacteria bacterium]|uniref:DNA polymerase III subunit alpha n=1 Tax=Candidatus Zymogenus saltonus TaxID=2844893 RepID=A0A9D8KDW9_9DELT|nr:DNA polymerase III subunit alpha [Candidatus Zymogenus saltonus]
MAEKRTSNFVHLHLHTQYSLLDGAIRLDDLFSAANDFNMPAVAITDHGNLFGAVDFYIKARDAGIKPIIGCEMYVARGRYDSKGGGAAKDDSHHLVLLVENEAGYKNLTRLLTHAHLEGFYYKPRVDKELLSKHSGGLVASSACLKSEIAEKILGDDKKGAREVAGMYAGMFPGRFYLELMENGIEDQRRVNTELIRISKEMNLPLVATNDCHYLKKSDSEAHDALLCIQTGKTINDTNRMKFSTNQFYFKSPEEMTSAFRDVPEAIKNTLAVAERCDFSFSFGRFQFPEYSVSSGESLDDVLDRAAIEGLKARMDLMRANRGGNIEGVERQYRDRLERELRMIKEMGFSGYFLIVADFIDYAKENSISVGPGRGSAAGSLVAYALGITDIDPIEYDLLFERFLNPERISMPDIDIDFCKNGRDDVIRYVSEKYGGEEKVAQIVTFGKMQARAVIRDVGRVLDMPYPDVDRIAKLIPAMPLNITLDDALKAEPRFKEMVDSDPKVQKLVKIAKGLEGLNRHSSTHAAGMVISNLPLVEYMPLTRGQKGEVVTQFDMKCVEKLGLIKFDFLGLRTLTVIEDAIKLIRENRGVDLDISKISLKDPETFKLLQSGNTDGVFQLESSGMKDLMVRLIPEKFEEVIALVALYRPGPLNTGMAEEFIKRKHNRKLIKYELPQLEEILGDTYGVMVYQEQVMQIATALANFTIADGDLLRRAMGKKIREEMAAQKEKFMEGALKNGINEKKAEKIFDQMEEFAEYGFNKSHSAAYAMVSYRTAFLKAHYPVEFMAALLTSEMDDTDKIMKYIGEAREMGINVLPPHINDSGLTFSASGDEILFGLAAVKNVGAAAIQSIIESRRDGGDFSSLFDFAKRVDLRKVNKRVLESLIKCGAFDFSNVSRARMMAAIDRAVEMGQSYQDEKRIGQANLFENLIGPGDGMIDSEEYPDVPDWSDQMLMANEKESLGFYITGHPLLSYENAFKSKTNCDTITINEKPDRSSVWIGGICAAKKEIMTKKGDRMAFLTLEDMKGFIEVVVFSDLYQKSIQLMEDDVPILVGGVLDRGDETSKVLAKEILSLKDAPIRGEKKVFIEMDNLSVPAEDIERLKQIMERHRGRSRVFLLVRDSDSGSITLSLPGSLGVDPSNDFINEVKTLFSGGSVWLD